MTNINVNTSPLIPSQFPEFFQENSNTYITFVKAYYEWMQTPNNVNYQIRNLLNYRDIDKTIDDFMIHFKLKYLNDIQFSTATNKRLLIKHSKDLYNTKGSERGDELFFQLVYGVPVEIYYPKNNIFKTSDNTWQIPNYLEVTNSPLLEDYIGKEIQGIDSGAIAFVDRLVRRKANQKLVNIFYISDISGNFIANEPLIISGNTTITNPPYFLGCLSEIQIISGGESFTNGEIVNLVSNNGSYGRGLITNTSSQSETLSIDLVDGGFGYYTNTQIIISTKILTLANIVLSNTSLNVPYSLFETFNQPLANITFFDANNNFNVGDIINEWSNSTHISGNAQILSISQNTGSNTGSLLISILSGNMDSQSTFFKNGNSIQATINVYTDQTATANIMGISTTANLFLNDVVGNFIVGEIVYQSNGTTNVGSGTIRNLIFNSSNSTITLNLSNTKGLFIYGNTVQGSISGSSGNVQSYGTQIGVFDIANSFVSTNLNYTYSSSGNTFATIIRISQGSGANALIGSYNNTEIDFLNSDLLSDNNSNNVPFMKIKLDGSNSNLASNAYGFPANTSLGPNSIIDDCLVYFKETLGSIDSLTGLDPGSNYTDPPMILCYDQFVAGFNYYDQILTLDDNISGSFNIDPGEVITQNIGNGKSLGISNVNGTFEFTELIYQSNGTANVAEGIVSFSNSSTLYLKSTNGTFTNTFTIVGFSSGANANITSIDDVNFVAKGQIRTYSNSSVLFVKRLSLENEFVMGNAITGQLSGATANIIYVDLDYSSNVMGMNAIIDTNLITANGVVSNMIPFNSGIGYSNGEIVTFISQDKTNSGTIRIILGNQGHGEGSFLTTSGFTSYDQHLQDGFYYQTFSYVLKTSIPLEVYGDMYKKVMHVAGFKLFGEVVVKDEQSHPPIMADFSIVQS